jgi:hypothetical protein
MHKCILVSLLVLAWSGAIYAGEWREVVRGVNSTGYADVDSIRRAGAVTAMRVLVDYPKPPFDGNNLPYRSLTMLNEYQCQEKRFRVLTITSHVGNMGGGERPYTTDEPGAWETVSPQTIQNELWALACAPDAARQ